MIGKSKKNIEVEKYVDAFIQDNGIAPSYDMIAKKFRISKSAAYQRCEKFRDKFKQSIEKVISKCRLCNQPTDFLFNINFNQIPICRRCSKSIYLQESIFISEMVNSIYDDYIPTSKGNYQSVSGEIKPCVLINGGYYIPKRDKGV